MHIILGAAFLHVHIPAQSLTDHVETVELVEDIEFNYILSVFAGDGGGGVGETFGLLIGDFGDAVVVEIGPGFVEFLFVGVCGGVDCRCIMNRVVEGYNVVLSHSRRGACLR